MFLKLFGMNEATLMRGPPDGGKRSARTHPVFRGLLSNSPMAVSLRHLGISLDAGQPCLKSPGFNPSALTAAHVQLVLVMYTPSFRPFVSEIVIRWSAGRPAASRLCKQKDRRIDRRSFR